MWHTQQPGTGLGPFSGCSETSPLHTATGHTFRAIFRLLQDLPFASCFSLKFQMDGQPQRAVPYSWRCNSNPFKCSKNNRYRPSLKCCICTNISNTFCVHLSNLLSYSTTYYDPILLMRKLRHREVTEFNKIRSLLGPGKPEFKLRQPGSRATTFATDGSLTEPHHRVPDRLVL